MAYPEATEERWDTTAAQVKIDYACLVLNNRLGHTLDRFMS